MVNINSVALFSKNYQSTKITLSSLLILISSLDFVSATRSHFPIERSTIFPSYLRLTFSCFLNKNRLLSLYSKRQKFIIVKNKYQLLAWIESGGSYNLPHHNFSHYKFPHFIFSSTQFPPIFYNFVQVFIFSPRN